GGSRARLSQDGIGPRQSHPEGHAAREHGLTLQVPTGQAGWGAEVSSQLSAFSYQLRSWQTYNGLPLLFGPLRPGVFHIFFCTDFLNIHFKRVAELSII